MISIILLILLVFIVFLALILRVTFKNQTKRVSNVLSITIPVLVVVFFVAIIVENYYHRTVQEKELSSLNSALDYTLSPRLFKTDVERQNCIDSLKKYDLKINEIAEWDSIISLFVGKDKKMSAQIERTNSVIKKLLDANENRREQQELFNRYMRSLELQSVEDWSSQLDEAEEALAIDVIEEPEIPALPEN